MPSKEEQQKALNAKRALRKKQIAQLRASNEMLEATKEGIIKRYGAGSETAEHLLEDIDVAKEQNLERAASYLGASQAEVESTQYNKVSPEEEKAYFDRLKRQGKSDEELHIKDLTKLSEKKRASMARTTAKPKSKLAEITEKLRKLGSKTENIEDIDEDDDIMMEIPPEEIIAPNAGDVTLKPYEQEQRFDDVPLEDLGKPVSDNEDEEKDNSKLVNPCERDEKVETPMKAEVKESVKEPEKVVKPSVEQKSCKDFDPRDVPSYVQYDIIPLPSKGECYPHKKGNIPVAYLTAADENLITSRNMYENGSMIDIILERKILDKSIRVADLCKGDRDAIAIWLRATAYGTEYPIIATYQGEEIQSVIDLSDIHFLDFKLKGDENGWFEYKVPSNGDVIKFKVLTYGEDADLIKKNTLVEEIVARDSIVENMDKSIEYVKNIDNKDKDEIIEAIELVKKWCLDVNINFEEYKDKMHLTYLTDRMVAQTMAINGNTDREYIKNYIENMRANDAVGYRKYANENVPGVDLNITVPIPESMGGGSFNTFLSIGETIFINV